MADIDTVYNTNQKLSDQLGGHKVYWKNAKNVKSQAQYELDKWQAEFDYEYAKNSPSAQLQRLYDADINPLFGSDFAGQISHGDASISNPPESPLSQMLDVGKSFQGIADWATQKDLANSQIKLNQSAGDLNKAQARKAGSETTLNEIRSQTEFDTRLAELRKTISEGNLNDERTNEVKANIMQSWQYLANSVQDSESRFIGAVSQYGNMLASQYGAVTDRMNAQTNAGELALHQKEYTLNVDKFNQAVKEFNFGLAGKIIDGATSNILGNKVTDDLQIQNIFDMYNTLSDVFSGKITRSDFKDLKPEFTNSGAPSSIAKGLNDVDNSLRNSIVQGFNNDVNRLNDAGKLLNKLQMLGFLYVNKMINGKPNGTLYLDENGDRIEPQPTEEE